MRLFQLASHQRIVGLRYTAPLLLLMAQCGGSSSSSPGNGPVIFGLTTKGNGVVSVRYDGKTVTGDGATLSRTYSSLGGVQAVGGTIETLDANAQVRATTSYTFGTYCTDRIMPAVLAQETQSFDETPSFNGGVPSLTLTSVKCIRRDGSGVEGPP